MGKRKTAKKPQAKKKAGKMATKFECLFCNNENSVTVKLNKKASIGELTCANCDQRYQAAINVLSQEYDVWYDWQDACDHVAVETASGGLQTQLSTRAPVSSGSTAAGRSKHADDELDDATQDHYEDDGFIERDDEDAEADYGGA